MKLYEVTLTKTTKIIVEAESPDDAYVIADKQGEDALLDDHIMLQIEEPRLLKPDNELPHHWYGNCLPYRCRSRSDEPEKTISELRGMSK